MNDTGKWRVFWGISLLSFTMISISCLLFLKLPLPHYPKLGLIFLVGTLIFFFVSISKVATGYPFWKVPISAIGRSQVKGINNRTASVLYLIASTFDNCLTMTLAILLYAHFSWDPWLIALSFILLCAAVAGMQMAVVPIDISRFGHLGSALVYFSFYLAGDIIILAGLYVLQPESPIYVVLGLLHLVASLFYMVGYLAHFYASAFQKIWFFTYKFSVFGFIVFFTNLLLR